MAIARISFFLSFSGLRLRLQRGSLQILGDRQKNETSWSLAGLLHDIGDWNLMSQFSKSDTENFSQTSVRYKNSKKFWCLNVRKNQGSYVRQYHDTELPCDSLSPYNRRSAIDLLCSTSGRIWSLWKDVGSRTILPSPSSFSRYTEVPRSFSDFLPRPYGYVNVFHWPC